MDEKMLARMMEALDGEMGPEERIDLAEAVDQCAEWDRLEQVDQMLRREPMVRPPQGFSGRVIARLDRRYHRRRVLLGGISLGFGAVATALLLICLPLFSLPPVMGDLIPLFEAGKASVTILGEAASALLGSLWVTADVLILKLLPLALFGFCVALVANLVWLGLIRKLHRAPVRVQS